MNSEAQHIDFEKVISHWIDSSNDDFKTMLQLYESKSYTWALFLGHITIEKLLKAVYVKIHKTHPPFIHNLYRLAELCEIEMSNEHSDLLDKITSFNLNARYEDYKKEFYNQCTSEYTSLWIENIKSIRLWINQML